jgi:hypothetical protein
MTTQSIFDTGAGRKFPGGARPFWLRLPRRLDAKLRRIARFVEHGRVREQIAADGVFS